MMRARDYEAIASALREGLDGGQRVIVFNILSPVFEDLNPRFKPEKFGKEMGLEENTINFLIDLIEKSKKEVAQNGR